MRIPRITRNILSNYVLGGFTSVSTVIITPLMFTHLGPEPYGMLSFALAVVTVVEMLDLGLSSALVRFASRHVELKEWADVQRISSSILFLLSLLGCVMFLIIATGLWVSDGFRATPIPGMTKGVFLIFGATLPFQLASAALRAYLIGIYDFYLANLVDGVNVFARAVIVIGLLLLGYGVLPIAMTFAIFSIVRMFGLLFAASRSSVPLNFEFANVRLGSVTSLARYSAGIFVQDITTGLFFQLDTIIAARVLAWSDVAVLTIARRLPGMLVQLAHRALAAISPEFAGVWARDDRTALHRMVIRTTNLLMVSLFGGVTLFVWAEPVLYHWIGSAEAAPALRAFAIFGVAAALQELPVALFYSIGRVRLSSTVAACTTLTAALLGTMAAARFGVLGLACVWAGTQSLATLILAIWGMHCIDLDYGRWLREGVLNGALSCAGIALIWHWIVPLTRGELSKMLAAIGIGLILFFYFGLRSTLQVNRTAPLEH